MACYGVSCASASAQGLWEVSAARAEGCLLHGSSPFDQLRGMVKLRGMVFCCKPTMKGDVKVFKGAKASGSLVSSFPE